MQLAALYLLKPGHTANRSGFTLIELSIVLVIIGLVIGGILVGNDLIRAATERKVISEIEQLDTAVQTFRLKYNGIPGDVDTATAAAFGGTAIASYAGSGVFSPIPAIMGNGKIDGCFNTLCSESSRFSTHLKQAGLLQLVNWNVQGSYYFAQSSAFPRGYYTPENWDWAGIAGNWLVLEGGDWHTGIWPAGQTQHTTVLSGSAAARIDTKMDDGKPMSGRTQSAGYANGVADNACVITIAGFAGTCLFGQPAYGCTTTNVAATSLYKQSELTGDVTNVGCKLAFRMTY